MLITPTILAAAAMLLGKKIDEKIRESKNK